MATQSVAVLVINMGLSQTLQFILRHPVNKGRPISTLARFTKWQLQSRIQDEVIIDWIDGAKLAVRRGMAGATGNIYCGLHEFTDMAFVLHLLHPGDLFIDAGANIGSYTVLASKVCGAYTISIEPDPDTIVHLQKNVDLNGIERLVTIVETAVGAQDGSISFTVGRDTVNQVAIDTEGPTRNVKLASLDTIVGNAEPIMIKMDVEGYEAEVLKGAFNTLSKPSLIAIETETSDSSIMSLLAEFGFERLYYDPISRVLSNEVQARPANNALLVRSVDTIQKRLTHAATRLVLGQTI